MKRQLTRRSRPAQYGPRSQHREGAGVREAFDQLAFSHRGEHVRAVEEAKRPETRERRIAEALEMLPRSV